MKHRLFNTCLILVGGWCVVSLVLMQFLGCKNSYPSFGWPFLAAQYQAPAVRFYWRYLVIDCSLVVLLLSACVVFLVVLARQKRTQWSVLTLLRGTAFAAILLIVWESGDFLNSMVLDLLQRHDTAYLYSQYDMIEPPHFMLAAVWFCAATMLELVWLSTRWLSWSRPGG